MNKRKLLIAFCTLLLTVTFNNAIAQPGGGGDPDPPKPVPITGIELLLLAGAAFGVKKIVSGKAEK